MNKSMAGNHDNEGSPLGRISTGGWISIGGLVFVLLALFLPIVTSNQFSGITDNSLIQRTDGVIFLVLIAASIGLLARSEIKRAWTSSIGVIIIGILLCLVSVLSFRSDALRTLVPAGGRPDDLYGALDYMAATEWADPGSGLILVLLGSIAVLAGGVWATVVFRQASRREK